MVDRARSENEAGERDRATPKGLNTHAVRDLTLQNDHLVFRGKPRCSSGFCVPRVTRHAWVLVQWPALLTKKSNRAGDVNP